MVMNLIKTLSICLLAFLYGCQANTVKPESVCWVDFEISKQISRLNDEGDHLSWVPDSVSKTSKEEDRVYSQDYFDEYFDTFYDAWLSTLRAQEISIKEPSDFIQDDVIIAHQYQERDSVYDSYYPVEYIGLSRLRFKKMHHVASDNGCDYLVKLKIQWVQKPAFKFLKKPHYHLGALTTLRLYDPKTKKVQTIEWLKVAGETLPNSAQEKGIVALLSNDVYRVDLDTFRNEYVRVLSRQVQGSFEKKD